jgi:DHA2 family multidrug resistance protein
MLCGLAQSLGEMVLFRIVQGMFGAALVPLSQAIMLELYPVEQRGQAMAIWGVGVLVGPVLGPTLGGYLTEIYNWRWVFYVNLPFGILATIGLILFFGDGVARKAGQFDWLGFTTLGLGVGALQLLLDRGELKDWFGSTEIVTEAVLTGLGVYLFVVHTMTARRPLLAPRIFTDVNFVAGCLIGFAVFVILFASNALLAPFLQTLANYPVESAGLLLAPRGLGTMVAMLAAGRLIGKTDARLLMGTGLVAIATSLWQMTGWTPDVSRFEIIANAVIQGIGIGLVFIPVTVVTFATISVELRTDGTAFFNLVRNVGGAIGISVTSLLLVRDTQIVHAQLATHVNPFNRMLQSGGAFKSWNIADPATVTALNAEITRQGAIIGYVDNFKLMMFLCVPALLLLLLLRKPQAAGKGVQAPMH